MKFPYKIIALSSALLVATLPNVQAAESSIPVEFTGSVALTTDYVFRGISLSDEDLAIQGEFDATHASGAYIGTWASNVSNMPDGGSLELDVYAGYAGEMNGFGYDVFATRFIYPGTGKGTTTKDHQYNDYHEFSLALSYSLPIGTEFGVRYDYAPHWFGKDTGKADNYLFTVGHELPMGISFGASIGRQDFREEIAGTDYSYFGANVAYSINDFTLALNFSNSNLKDANGNDQEDADERVFFTLSKEF